MSGEKKLVRLIKEMTPVLHEGTYVFCSVKNAHKIPREDTIGEFIEEEGTTIILKKEKADQLDLSYDYIASWITLKIHSSLDAVGLTAVFSSHLAKHQISCNVIAGYYHDHIFVDEAHGLKAVMVLKEVSEKYPDV